MIAAGTAFGVAGCGESNEAAETGAKDEAVTEEVTEEAAEGEESPEFIADMADGVEVVNEQISKEGDTSQVMLASDVEKPTQKYGMWVLPYHPSDAVEKYTMQIEVENGNFVVTAVSAETGKTWTMDQDGNMEEAAE